MKQPAFLFTVGFMVVLGDGFGAGSLRFAEETFGFGAGSLRFAEEYFGVALSNLTSHFSGGFFCSTLGFGRIIDDPSRGNRATLMLGVGYLGFSGPP